MTLADDAMRVLPALAFGFVLAFVATLLLTPLVRRYARMNHMVDRPEARRVNTRIVARGGGIAIAVGFLGVSLLLVSLNRLAGLDFVAESDRVPLGQLWALLAGGVLAVVIGLLDDVFQLKARWQFLGQFALAGFAVAFGVSVTRVNVPFAPDGWAPPEAIAALAAFVWIVCLVNSLNFIDGLDGLSTGIALIAALTLGALSLGGGSDVDPSVAIFCFVLAGSLAGFLRWNFHPATIFSGTSGIAFVGYTLAVLAVLGAGKIAVALLVLGVPIMDTFWIVIRRVASGRSPFSPDRGHIHHRLLDLGLSHRGTVLVIYAACLLLAALSLVLSGRGQMYAFLGLIVLFGLALLGIEKLGGGSKAVEESLDAASYEANGTAGTTAGDPDRA